MISRQKKAMETNFRQDSVDWKCPKGKACSQPSKQEDPAPRRSPRNLMTCTGTQDNRRIYMIPRYSTEYTHQKRHLQDRPSDENFQDFQHFPTAAGGNSSIHKSFWAYRSGSMVVDVQLGHRDHHPWISTFAGRPKCPALDIHQRVVLVVVRGQCPTQLSKSTNGLHYQIWRSWDYRKLTDMIDIYRHDTSNPYAT